MTKTTLNKRIKKYEQEAEELVAAHGETVQQLQKSLDENRNKYQQVMGKIEELKELSSYLGQDNGE